MHHDCPCLSSSLQTASVTPGSSSPLPWRVLGKVSRHLSHHFSSCRYAQVPSRCGKWLLRAGLVLYFTPAKCWVQFQGGLNCSNFWFPLLGLLLTGWLCSPTSALHLPCPVGLSCLISPNTTRDWFVAGVTPWAASPAGCVHTSASARQGVAACSGGSWRGQERISPQLDGLKQSHP